MNRSTTRLHGGLTWVALAAAVGLAAWAASIRLLAPAEPDRQPVTVPAAPVTQNSVGREPHEDLRPAALPTLTDSPQPLPAAAVPAEQSSGEDVTAVDAGQAGYEDPVALESGGKESEGGDTLFLTIVGDKTFVTRGKAGDRPPRIAELQSHSAPVPAGSVAVPTPGGSQYSSNGFSRAGTSADSGGTDASTDGLNVGNAQARAAAGATANPVGPSAPAAAPDGGNQVDDRPFNPDGSLDYVAGEDSFAEPPPNENCPWTLPAGTTASDAARLQAEAGCRYLSSCTYPDGNCTWHFMGS